MQPEHGKHQPIGASPQTPATEACIDDQLNVIYRWTNVQNLYMLETTGRLMVG
jgi:hypothetical protein